MRIHAAHAMFIHCACHRLQLASVQAAENVTEVKKSSRIFVISFVLGEVQIARHGNQGKQMTP